MPLHFTKTPKARYIVSTVSDPFTAIIGGRKWTVAAHPAICSRTGRTIYLYSYQFRLWKQPPLGNCDMWLVFDADGRELARATWRHEALAAV